MTRHVPQRPRLELLESTDSFEIFAQLPGVPLRDVAVEFASGLGGPGTKLFAVGGDHSIAYANIKATWERRGTEEAAEGAEEDGGAS